jgi:hypothetical protein
MPHVYSTATAGQDYIQYEKGPNDTPIPVRTVRIAGGANLANKNFLTPRGVSSTVTDDELEFLKKHPHFQHHMKAGFMTYDEKKRASDIDDVVGDMKAADKSAPKTPKDFEKGNGAKPVSLKEAEAKAKRH